MTKLVRPGNQVTTSVGVLFGLAIVALAYFDPDNQQARDAIIGVALALLGISSRDIQGLGMTHQAKPPKRPKRPKYTKPKPPAEPSP